MWWWFYRDGLKFLAYWNGERWVKTETVQTTTAN